MDAGGHKLRRDEASKGLGDGWVRRKRGGEARGEEGMGGEGRKRWKKG